MSNRRGLLLCLVGVMCLTAFPLAQSPSPAEAPTVIATGDTIVMHPPDRAFVTIGVEARDGDPDDAERKAAETMAKVQEAIRALGIGADAMRTVSFRLRPRHQLSGGGGYLVRHAIEVRVDDLATLGDLLDAAGEARAATISSLRFDLKDRRRAEIAALRAAVEDATARAQAIAESSGRSIAEVLRIQEHRLSSPGIVLGQAGAPAPGAAGRGGGSVSTLIEPGEIQIRAQVTLTATVK
jgi:hypothetical protein